LSRIASYLPRFQSFAPSRGTIQPLPSGSLAVVGWRYRRSIFKVHIPSGRILRPGAKSRLFLGPQSCGLELVHHAPIRPRLISARCASLRGAIFLSFSLALLSFAFSFGILVFFLLVLSAVTLNYCSSTATAEADPASIGIAEVLDTLCLGVPPRRTALPRLYIKIIAYSAERKDTCAVDRSKDL
jgi:hypothetical protein